MIGRRDSREGYIVAFDIRQIKFSSEELRDSGFPAASWSYDHPNVAWVLGRSRAHARSGLLWITNSQCRPVLQYQLEVIV